MNSEKHTSFHDLLIRWYRDNARPLPWRQTREPYPIWLSEVILQQTRIQQGLAYYLKFTEAYPTINELAEATIDEVLKHWQGLGYYTRARNLHETARFIIKNFNGEFPANYQSIRKLKGIGDYTAAAIASICFGQPFPVLDGNVYRVMSRYLALNEPVNSIAGKRKVMEFLKRHISAEEPGDFNQALMELGALLCTPKSPDCDHCPLNQQCTALRMDRATQFPVAAAKKDSKARHLNYLVINDLEKGSRRTYLYKREGDDIWKGLYEFPIIESDKKLGPEDLTNLAYFKQLFPGKTDSRISLLLEMTHILTHQKLKIRFYLVDCSGKKINPPQDWIKMKWNEVHSYPVSRMTEKFLEFLKTEKLRFFDFFEK